MADLRADLDRYLRVRDRGTPAEWGPAAWAVLHGVAESIPCEPCRAHGRDLLSAVHDTVNVHLGKRARDPKTLCLVAADMASVAGTHGSCRIERFLCSPGRFD